MSAGQSKVFALKSWADDIDELNRDALEAYLEGAWPRRGSTRTSRMVVGNENVQEEKRVEVGVEGHLADRVLSISPVAGADLQNSPL